jgi:hypothetical protein
MRERDGFSGYGSGLNFTGYRADQPAGETEGELSLGDADCHRIGGAANEDHRVGRQHLAAKGNCPKGCSPADAFILMPLSIAARSIIGGGGASRHSGVVVCNVPGGAAARGRFP